jgi:ABC-2 type transport system permease protein
MKYVFIARTRLMGALMYDRDLLVRSAFMFVALLVFIQLWTTTYGSTNQSVIQGFSLRHLVWYLVVTELVALSTPRIAQAIDTEVRSGDISYALSRPYSYPLYHLASYWGETLVRLPLNALVGGAVAFIAVGPPPTDAPAIVAATVAMAGAITLKGIIEVLIGVSAFWFENTEPMEWIYNKFLFTIGGLFLPLDLFPDWLATISRGLPFAAIAYAPARAFVGLDWAGFLPLLLTQATWLVLGWVAMLVLFRRATHRLATHGG